MNTWTVAFPFKLAKITISPLNQTGHLPNALRNQSLNWFQKFITVPLTFQAFLRSDLWRFFCSAFPNQIAWYINTDSDDYSLDSMCSSSYRQKGAFPLLKMLGLFKKGPVAQQLVCEWVEDHMALLLQPESEKGLSLPAHGEHFPTELKNQFWNSHIKVFRSRLPNVCSLFFFLSSPFFHFYFFLFFSPSIFLFPPPTPCPIPCLAPSLTLSSLLFPLFIPTTVHSPPLSLPHCLSLLLLHSFPL